MDTLAGMSPSMESVVAGLAGFTLASLLSFARKLQVVKQEPTAPAAHLSTDGSASSNPNYIGPPIHVPGMGHDFHVLARLVAEKQRLLQASAPTCGPEETMRQIFNTVHPKLVEYHSLEWHAKRTRQNNPHSPEIVVRVTEITYAANAPLQDPRSSTHPGLKPAFPRLSECQEGRSELVSAKRDEQWSRLLENTYEEAAGVQRNQRGWKSCGRDKGDENRRSHRGWCRSRANEDERPASRGWWGPRGDHRDRWGWSQYREEGYN